MSVAALILAAGATASPFGSAAALTCNLELPDGTNFQMDGHFDEGGLHSNLADLIKIEGDFPPSPVGIVITSDGTDSRRWQLRDVSSSQKFDASLTRYGTDVAVLLLERQTFIGRHWGRDVVGVGFCDVRSSQAGEKES